MITSIRAIEVDLDPGNYTVPEVLAGQLLDILEREHNEYVDKEGLDINLDPEKSYIKEFKDKLERARTKHKTRLGILPTSSSQSNPQMSGQVPPAESRADYIPGEDDLGDKMTSVSKTWSDISRSSRGPALLHKLKHNKSKIQAAAEAVEMSSIQT